MIELPYPAKPLWPNFRSRTHWAKTTATKKARADGFNATKAAKVGIIAGDVPIRLLVTVHPPTANPPDRDNAQASCKAYFDGIADALKVNDRFFEPETVIGAPMRPGRVFVAVNP